MSCPPNCDILCLRVLVSVLDELFDVLLGVLEQSLAMWRGATQRVGSSLESMASCPGLITSAMLSEEQFEEREKASSSRQEEIEASDSCFQLCKSCGVLTYDTRRADLGLVVLCGGGMGVEAWNEKTEWVGAYRCTSMSGLFTLCS